MRILSVILCAAAMGANIGAAIAYVEVRPGGAVPPTPTRVTTQAALPANAAARIKVDEPVYNFGTMQRGTTKSHEFVVHNIGDAPLTLANGGTTCKCTIGDVS